MNLYFNEWQNWSNNQLCSYTDKAPLGTKKMTVFNEGPFHSTSLDLRVYSDGDTLFLKRAVRLNEHKGEYQNIMCKPNVIPPIIKEKKTEVLLP